MTKPKRIGEPIQVYLSERDRALLETLTKRTDMPRSEVLRVALRRMAAELSDKAREQEPFHYLIGILGDDPSSPGDLSVNHDKYIYGDDHPKLNAGRNKRNARRR